MSDLIKEAIRLFEMLPEGEQAKAVEVLRKLVVAWDPDFVKVTAEEARQIEAAEASGFVDEGDIDWDNIGIDE